MVKLRNPLFSCQKNPFIYSASHSPNKCTENQTQSSTVGYCITIKYFKLEGMTLKSVHNTRTVVLLKQKDPTSMGLFPHVHHSNILHSFEPLCTSTVNGRCTSCIVDIPTIALSAGAHWMSLIALACGAVCFRWCVVFVDRGYTFVQ